MTRLLGQHHHDRLRLGRVVLVRPEVDGAVLRGQRRLVVQPAELQLVPSTEVRGAGADGVVAGCGLPALRHDRPPVHGVVRGIAGVVEVGQTEVVAVLVGDGAHAAVLGLHGVVADPQPAVGDLAAALLALCRSGHALVALVDEPAVGPDGVLALDLVTVGLVAAGVDDLEVVEVAVGLVEVAVTVDVVAVPLVERLELGHHGGLGAALRQLIGVPLVDGVADQVLAVVADDVGADVGVGVLEVARAAVAGLVVLHLHPVRDGAVDAVAARRLAFVVLAHRLDLAARTGRATTAEVEVLEVVAAVVRLPDRRVVLRPVRLRDLVVQRPVPGHRAGRRRVDVLVGVLRVAGVAELGEHHEDPVGLLTAQLDVLVLGDRLAGRRRLAC